jgi:hypothetical protein
MINPKISPDGYKWWSDDTGGYHNKSGPAIVWEDGSQVWYINGKLHRTDGPAYIDINGHREWYVNGHAYTSDWSYQKAANLSDEDMIAVVLKYGNVE